MKYAFFCLLAFVPALSLPAAEPTTPPAAATDTASHVVLPAGKKLGGKATTHRFEKLRAGAIKTAKGWNVQDFASSFFNPNPLEITVTIKMVSDDPKFVFAASDTTYASALGARVVVAPSESPAAAHRTATQIAPRTPGRAALTSTRPFSSAR